LYSAKIEEITAFVSFLSCFANFDLFHVTFASCGNA